MSRVDAGRVIAQSGFPRVSGDEPFLSVIGLVQKAFSPRERG